MRRRVLVAVGAALTLSAAAFSWQNAAVADSANPAQSSRPTEQALPAAPPQPTTLQDRPPVVTARMLERFPHDPTAFTQGLFFSGGKLFETTGIEGRSTLREVDLTTGKVKRQVALPPTVFGEGATDWGSEILSITWRTGIGYRWDRASFRQRGQFNYTGEGWGLTQDGRRLILSDGTPVLRFLNPKSFQETGRVTVTFAGRPLANLNELEWVDGALWANVWHQDALVRIDPANGRVTQVLDLAPLVAEVQARDPEAVPNGIAWDAKTRRLYVTGKNWPALFQIELPPAP